MECKKMPEIKKYPAWEELTFANNFLFCKIMELADGMDVNLVAKYTGLSVETIKAELLE